MDPVVVCYLITGSFTLGDRAIYILAGSYMPCKTTLDYLIADSLEQLCNIRLSSWDILQVNTSTPISALCISRYAVVPLI